MWDKDKYITDTYISRINGAQMVNMGIDAEAELKRFSNMGIDAEAELKRLSKMYGTEVKIGDTLIMPDAKEDRRKYLLIRR